MELDNLIQGGFILVCIILSAFFSSSETALTSIGLLKARQLEGENNAHAGILRQLLETPQKFITAILIGNNIVNIAASSVATVLFMDIFGKSGVVLATVIMTVVVLIFGEITPKSLAQEHNEKIALKVARPIKIMTVIFRPLIYLLNRFTSFIMRIFLPENRQRPLITEEELQNILSVSDEQGILEDEETKIIKNVLEFGECQAVDVMTPRTSIVSIDINTDKEELLSILSQEIVFSRFPVYEDNIDDIIGILHVKDLITAMRDFDHLDLRNYLKEAFYAYEYMPIIELFKQMKINNVSLAIIIDEYGGTSGVVSIEDIIEELVGEIDDEYDEMSHIKMVSPHIYMLDPTLRIDDFNEYFNTELYSEKFESIGGFVIGQLNRIPVDKDIVDYDNLQFVVEKVEQRRITKLKLILKNLN